MLSAKLHFEIALSNDFFHFSKMGLDRPTNWKLVLVFFYAYASFNIMMVHLGIRYNRSNKRLQNGFVCFSNLISTNIWFGSESFKQTYICRSWTQFLSFSQKFVHYCACWLNFFFVKLERCQWVQLCHTHCLVLPFKLSKGWT